MNASLLSAVACVTIAGATFSHAQLGPDYERPATAMPARFKNGVKWREGCPSSHLDKGDWWRVYKDSRLHELLVRATANNQSLKAAIARFDQARATAGMARADFFPTANVPLTYEQQRTSSNMPSAFPLNGARYEGPSYTAMLDFSWEIDLWGKVRRQSEAARADAGAAADAMHNILLGIQADVATNYFRLRTVDAEIRVLKAAVGMRRQALAIASARVKAGAGSELEEAQALTEVAAAEAEVSASQAQRDQLENVIAILIGASPSSFNITSTSGTLSAPPSLPTGLPLDLLERRPDVSQAERTLAAATARIGVAKALFFPSVKLFARGGFLSGDIDQLLEPTSLMWNYGPSVTLPLFAGGKNTANYERSRAAHDEALANYRQALLTALADVENSLSSLENLATQASAQSRARASAERAAELARTRYEAGTSPYLDVIDANRTVLTTQRAATQVAGQRLLASVALIKALGGGWDQTLTPLVPIVNPDPAARSTPEGKLGFFSQVKGWFKKKDK